MTEQLDWLKGHQASRCETQIAPGGCNPPQEENTCEQHVPSETELHQLRVLSEVSWLISQSTRCLFPELLIKLLTLGAHSGSRF